VVKLHVRAGGYTCSHPQLFFHPSPNKEGSTCHSSQTDAYGPQRQYRNLHHLTHHLIWLWAVCNTTTTTTSNQRPADSSEHILSHEVAPNS
jgi:hypothetical protein